MFRKPLNSDLRKRDALKILILQVKFMLRYLKEEHVLSIELMSLTTPMTPNRVKVPLAMIGIFLTMPTPLTTQLFMSEIA